MADPLKTFNTEYPARYPVNSTGRLRPPLSADLSACVEGIPAGIASPRQFQSQSTDDNNKDLK